jgi:hypothetical protein
MQAFNQQFLNSFFLDSKLQNALNQSYAVKSQLRLNFLNDDDRPTILRGKTRRSNTVDRVVRKVHTVMFGKLLLESAIKSTVRTFLGLGQARLMELLVMKILRSRPIAVISTSLDPLNSSPVNNDEVLYVTYANKIEDQIQNLPDILDIDKLRIEIAQLEGQRTKLTKDFIRCKDFSHHFRTSDALLYYYYAQRLHYARACADYSKLRPMSGAYLSKMFDLKCQQIKMANDMERSLSTANSIVTTLIYNLQAQCHGIIHELLDIDRAYLAELEMKLQKNAEMQLEQRSEEQSNMCKALDEKLYKVIQATKYLVNISLAIELSKNLKLPEVIEQDPTVNMNYDDLYRSEVSSQTRQLKGMYNDLHNCMERCYQMATQRIQSKSIKMQNIFEGTTIFRTAYLSDVSAV